jgi:regulator of protease activity HflC (stomatin/prohibitin superfamily)
MRNYSLTGFISAVGIIVLVIIAFMFGYPKYRVWQQGLEGEAELKRAEQNRKIAVQEAEAKKEAAKSLADAEVIRAEGVAKANAIIGSSLKDNENYLKYLWIDNLEKNPNAVIYVPTENGMPIMEAGRLNGLQR